MATICKKYGIRQNKTAATNKARMAERAIRSVKRVIMAMYQTGNWQEEWSWETAVQRTEAALNGRYNRNIGTSPNNAVKEMGRLISEAWDKKKLQSPAKYFADRDRLLSGGDIKTLNSKTFALNDLVLIPKRSVKGGIGVKEFQIHYTLIPHRIVNIFHAQKPTLFKVKNVLTGEFGRRLFYAPELKKISLPEAVAASDIEDVRILPGTGLEYKLKNRGWVEIRP